MSVLVLCGRHVVAERFTANLMAQYPECVEFVEMQNAFYQTNSVQSVANRYGIMYCQHENEDKTIERIKELKLKGGVTTIVLAWWPKIVHKINKLGLNVINTHPSFLPYNRGKYPYYWAIMDGTPFGATIHRVDDGIDTGDILWRKEAKLDPTDTGETAYNKAVEAMHDLLYEHLEDIARERLPVGIKQNPHVATAHMAKDFELEPLAVGDDVLWPPKEFINDLRARTFDNVRSGRRIIIDGKTYRIHFKLVEEKQ